MDPHQLTDTALNDGIIEAEEIKNFKMTTCSNIHSRSYFYALQNLAETEGKSIFRCPNPSRVVWFLMAGYQLIASALLLNLVIAMFSNTFNRINSNAVLVWKFQVTINNRSIILFYLLNIFLSDSIFSNHISQSQLLCLH